MKEFKDKVAVITGGASGIGLGLARHSLREGMKVVIADIEKTALIQAEKELKTSYTDVLAVQVDVSRMKDIESLAGQALNAFGSVHLLFNNAGVGKGGVIWESTLDDWTWVINVNLWGIIHGIKVFVPIMLDQKSECHIVNTASIAGLNTAPGVGIYRMTKHAVVSISETLYHDLRAYGAPIGVSVLCPGPISTRVLDSERNRPEELSDTAEEIIPTPEQLSFITWFRNRVENGMKPEQVAELVFRAIREGGFYIITHPEYKEAIQLRMEDILQDRVPTLPKPELQ
jgi:NAD(P)-dependent dehydrogenase (short-subunit alcohol dehydrogenase family)